MSAKTSGIFPFLYHTWLLMKTGDVLHLAEKLLKKPNGAFEPYAFVKLPLGFTRIQNFLFIACPHMSREILHHHANRNSLTKKFDRGWIADIFRNELGDTLFTVEAAKHGQLRHFISQFFRQSLDKRFGANLCARTHDLIDTWLKYEGRPINANHDLPFFTSRAIIDNFIGEVQDPLRLHEAMEVILRNMERQFKLKRPFSKKRMLHAQQVVKESAAEVNRSGRTSTSLLSMMGEAKDEANQPLFSTEDIEAMARFLFLAGQETVASVLPAMLYHCTHELQQKVCDEWENEHLDSTSSDDLVRFSKKSKWVQAVINESLRLFPPSLRFFSRELRRYGH